ncbi:ATP-binding protein [aff. Roholtiella sp. LEGE 12411]|uniref:ATP-binding protein n=1 Tax=aff. Roholtiella sp. LEGE 12411 TaxID=1828822 RepID=UPI00187FE82A|nr:ATP-binding protein [aff. Roholtiella sp. LEGE 12411]MBE9037577.1 ATP-binding protein [aff. Roholtiella sp. LEGE 12411]
MSQPNSKNQSQEQDNFIKDTNVGRDLTFAPVQNMIETQIIQSSLEVVTQRKLNKNSPYQGLKRFNFKDRDRFFGRDKFIARLLKAVNQSSLSLVLGASGSGKSSVVRAGLIPELKKSLESQIFYDFIFTPNQDPFDSLYRCLLSEEKDYSFSKSGSEIALEAKADTLTQVINTLKKDGERWLIFVDQFEELFTICDEPDKRKNFIAGLVQVAKSGNSTVKIVLAMRSDFLEQFSSYPDLGFIANQNNIHLVTEMYSDELRQAIEQPAAKHGVLFEEGLVEQIIKEVEGQKGYLPLLQYTLNLLWESECKTLGTDGRPHIEDRTLNKNSYTALEGVRGSLQKRVNEIYSNLNQDEQITTKQIFLKLVNIVDTDSGSRAVSRRAYRDEFIGELVENTLTKFIDEKLLVSNSQYLTLEELRVNDIKQLKQSATVEIAHEILLSSWNVLKKWLEQEKEAIILKNWLAGETKRWQKIRLEDEFKSQDELLKGSRLSQFVEFRNENLFKNLGGLSQQEEEFINVSIEQRDRLEREKEESRKREIKRFRQITFGAITAGLIMTVLAIFAVSQLKSAQSAERGQREEIIRSAWLGLNRSDMTEPEKYQQCGTYLNVGLRSLYCDIKPFIDYEKLKIVSGLPIFRKGYNLTFQSEYEFGYYNPEFVKWLQENIIYAENNEIFRQQTQSFYDKKIRNTARASYRSYRILFATPEEFNTFIKFYQSAEKEYKERLYRREVNTLMFQDNYETFEAIKREYLKHLENKTLPDGYIQEKFRWLSDYLSAVENIDWYAANTSGGFWTRRSIDGTNKEFFRLLTKLLETYDRDWLREQETLGVKPSR